MTRCDALLILRVFVTTPHPFSLTARRTRHLTRLKRLGCAYPAFRMATAISGKRRPVPERRRPPVRFGGWPRASADDVRVDRGPLAGRLLAGRRTADGDRRDRLVLDHPTRRPMPSWVAAPSPCAVGPSPWFRVVPGCATARLPYAGASSTSLTATARGPDLTSRTAAATRRSSCGPGRQPEVPVDGPVDVDALLGDRGYRRRGRAHDRLARRRSVSVDPGLSGRPCRSPSLLQPAGFRAEEPVGLPPVDAHLPDGVG